MVKVRNVVVCNGYSLAENPDLSGDQFISNQKGELVVGKFGDWKKVCGVCSIPGNVERGYAPFEQGRIATSLRIAHLVDAELLVWTTGTTWLPGRTSEAKYMFNRAHEMVSFATHAWRNESWLDRISVLEEKSTNTATTMIEVKKLLDERFANDNPNAVLNDPVMVYMVSSANHIPRVIRDALEYFPTRYTLCGVSATTSYGGKTPKDVIIKELGEK